MLLTGEEPNIVVLCPVCGEVMLMFERGRTQADSRAATQICITDPCGMWRRHGTLNSSRLSVCPRVCVPACPTPCRSASWLFHSCPKIQQLHRLKEPWAKPRRPQHPGKRAPTTTSFVRVKQGRSRAGGTPPFPEEFRRRRSANPPTERSAQQCGDG